MKLSVIIPIYNVERTLDRCIESVLRQDVAEMEVILVDDGSPDNSPKLCDDWQSRDNRIRVVHKKNGGLSDARNKGIEIATGEIITFVDSDDELAPDTYPFLVQFMQENPMVDVLEYPVLVHAGHESECLRTFEDRIWKSNKDYWEQSEGWEHCYACNKIFRKRILESTQFPVDRIFEDTWFYPEVLSKGAKIATTSHGLYRYLWNNDGITVTANGDSFIHLLTAQQRAQKLMHTQLLSKTGWKLWRSMLFRQIDVYRLTGKILLKFPFCKAICVFHKRFLYKR